MSKKSSFLSLFCCLLLVAGCQNESEDNVIIEKPDLEGLWEVNKAFRNNAPTGTLEGAEFIFTTSLFSSNVPGFIFGENNVGEYRVSSDTIFTGILRPSHFLVNRFEEDEITLSAVIQGYNFKFELVRKEKNE